MNAYLFTSVSTITQVRPSPGSFRQTNTLQTWDACVSIIVVAETADKAQQRFEESIRLQPLNQNPMQIEIRKIAGAQFVDRLFTENGSEPLDWPQILELELTQAESTAVDSFEQGYWVDADEVIRPGKLSPNIEALQRDLSQDIATDLNWSADKQFLFVLSVFRPPPPPQSFDSETDVTDPPESQNEIPEECDAGGPGPAANDPINLRELYEMYPQVRDKEAAALIRARNAVVAAWLWRRYAADTRLASNQIRIDPSCEVIGLPDANEP